MSEDLVERLWPQARVSIARKVVILRRWQELEVDDATAAEVTHQLVGTLGSYRRHVAAEAAHDLHRLLQADQPDPRSEDAGALIDVIGRTVNETSHA